MTVMLLGGLWHGASWTFIAWGGIHGAMLSLERLLGKESIYHHLPVVIKTASTFLIVCIGWVFFRSDSLSIALRFLQAMMGNHESGEAASLLSAVIYTRYHLFSFLVCIAAVWLAPQAWNFTQRITPWKVGMCLLTLLLSVICMWTQTVNPFLYYQF